MRTIMAAFCAATLLTACQSVSDDSVAASSANVMAKGVVTRTEFGGAKIGKPGSDSGRAPS